MPIKNILSCGTCTPAITLPAQLADPSCNCILWDDGINEIYFIDCDAINAATIDNDILDLLWWSNLIADGNIYKFGLGTGAIGVKNAINRTVPDGCGGTKEIRTNTEWNLTYEKYCIDTSTAMSTHAEQIAIATGALKRYNVVVRYCKGEFVGWIGSVTLSSYDAPHNGTDGLKFTYEFSWKQLEPVIPINVGGLNGILPKAIASY